MRCIQSWIDGRRCRFDNGGYQQALVERSWWFSVGGSGEKSTKGYWIVRDLFIAEICHFASPPQSFPLLWPILTVFVPEYGLSVCYLNCNVPKTMQMMLLDYKIIRPILPKCAKSSFFSHLRYTNTSLNNIWTVNQALPHCSTPVWTGSAQKQIHNIPAMLPATPNYAHYSEIWVDLKRNFSR